MPRKCLLLLVIFNTCFFAACNWVTKDNDGLVNPPPPPDLCATTDNCDDGVLSDLLGRTWRPAGGIVEGQDLTHGCVDTLCPDIRFTFYKDSTYQLEMVLVVQDSTHAFAEQKTETGTYRAGNCLCMQQGNHWDGFYAEKTGSIHFSPSGGEAYTIQFLHYFGGLKMDFSSRDSTLVLFMN